MAKQLKTIYAGALQVAALYDRVNKKDNDRQRAAKQKASSEAQKRMNRIYSFQKLELLLAANFPTEGSGNFVTLTFDDQHLPENFKQVKARMKYFLQKLKAARRAAGLPEPVVIWAPEILTSANGRWHVHCVIDNTGQDYEMICKCWIYGKDIDCGGLIIDGEFSHERLAHYMSKEPRECMDYACKPGQHAWSHTQNVRYPETDTVTVPDDYQLSAPEGAAVLIDERRTTEYASWHVLKVRFAAAVFPPRLRAKRRRKPKV